jgi:hypothetical protein
MNKTPENMGSFLGSRLGQGRDRVVQYLREFPAVADEIEKVCHESLHICCVFWWSKIQGLRSSYSQSHLHMQSVENISGKICQDLSLPYSGDVGKHQLSPETVGSLSFVTGLRFM